MIENNYINVDVLNIYKRIESNEYDRAFIKKI